MKFYTLTDLKCQFLLNKKNIQSLLITERIKYNFVKVTTLTNLLSFLNNNITLDRVSLCPNLFFIFNINI